MDNFAFIIHPLDPKRDVKRKFPLLGKVLPVPAINFLSRFFPPLYISHITGVCSEATGKEVEGWFVACPFTPQRMMTLPPKTVYRKVIATARLAERLGAELVGLGAYTSVVGDGGVTISRSVNVPVTTGDSYTVASAVEALKKAAEIMEIDLAGATLAVVGATGAIGAVAAEMLAADVPHIVLIGKRFDRLAEVKARCERVGAEVLMTADLDMLLQADLVLTVTSAVEAIVQPKHLKPGAVVCDVARPRDVSKAVAEQRDDVFVFEGGLVEVPGLDASFNFDRTYAVEPQRRKVREEIFRFSFVLFAPSRLKSWQLRNSYLILVSRPKHAMPAWPRPSRWPWRGVTRIIRWAKISLLRRSLRLQALPGGMGSSWLDFVRSSMPCRRRRLSAFGSTLGAHGKCLLPFSFFIYYEVTYE